jgi:Cof subfamily protein (haloacid dehalogenase superfamily)
MNLPDFRTIPSAVAIDLDGTLFSTDLSISERNRKSLECCLQQGIPVIINTSRSERSTRRLLGKYLADRCSLITLNGAKVIGNAPLSGSIRLTIPPEAAKEIVELIIETEPRAWVTVEIEGFEFGCNKHFDAETLWQTYSATPDMVLPIEEAVARSPSKISVSAGGQDISKLACNLSEKYGHLISTFPSDGMKFLNLPPVRVSKLTALRRLLDPQGAALDNVLAFGDDIPDLVMLTECGISVAMANAAEEVRAAARYHTAANDDDGVALVIEKMLKTVYSG